MQIIKASYEILNPTTKEEGFEILKQIERAARTCYKSEDRIKEDGSSAVTLVKTLRDRKHDAMIEFGNITVKFIISRGISHEVVRHRIASYGQESTRFVSYKDGIQVIAAKSIIDNAEAFEVWNNCMLVCEESYRKLIDLGIKPEESRDVLPTALKTEIVVSTNIREWRHIFKLRTAKPAHPAMRQIMTPLLNELKELIPILFDDIEVDE